MINRESGADVVAESGGRCFRASNGGSECTREQKNRLKPRGVLGGRGQKFPADVTERGSTIDPCN